MRQLGPEKVQDLRDQAREIQRQARRLEAAQKLYDAKLSQALVDVDAAPGDMVDVFGDGKTKPEAECKLPPWLPQAPEGVP